MGVRWPRRMFGVEIVYVRDGAARRATTVLTGGSGVWALLPDGRVGTNDAHFFRYACVQGSQNEVRVAEKLWRLGKMKKSAYKKLADAFGRKQTRDHKRGVAADLKAYARQIGLELSKDQVRFLDKLAP